MGDAMTHNATAVQKAAGPVALTAEQKTLRDELERQLAETRSKFEATGRGQPEAIKKMGQTAHRLHMSLKASGNEPRHHRYMIENRGMKPDDPHFYDHIHPVEDLLKFIADRSANDDPEDQTIGHDFDFRVYSRRWGHDDTYRVRRTKTGWRFGSGGLGEVATGRDGRVQGQPGTGLLRFLDHDSINYPEELPGYLEWLWERAAEDGLTHEKVQDGLTQLAGWTSLVEKNSPSDVFAGYK
jgi:integron cassette protein